MGFHSFHHSLSDHPEIADDVMRIEVEVDALMLQSRLSSLVPDWLMTRTGWMHFDLSLDDGDDDDEARDLSWIR